MEVKEQVLIVSFPVLEFSTTAAIPDITSSVVAELPVPEIFIRQSTELLASFPVPSCIATGFGPKVCQLAGHIFCPTMEGSASLSNLTALSLTWPVPSVLVVSNSVSATFEDDLSGYTFTARGSVESGNDFVLVYSDPTSAESPATTTYDDEVLSWQN